MNRSRARMSCPPMTAESEPIALQNGVDIKTVSGMLGRFSAGFTLDTYAHVTTVAQKEAANIMANVLSCAAQSN